jgi:hypothetical protein
VLHESRLPAVTAATLSEHLRLVMVVSVGDEDWSVGGLALNIYHVV